MTEQVLFSINEQGLATITLNRPQVLNALSYEMVHAIGEKLTEWKSDDRVKMVTITGAGEKGLCAGGDIKKLYETRANAEDFHKAVGVFKEEYKTDMKVYEFPKPIVALLDGIVMGGGVGLTYGASHRIVTERTKWAMPEMNIGFFTDVGAAYFFNKAPGSLGRYLALTASIIKAPDVLYMNGADVYMPSGRLESFFAQLHEMNWHENDVARTLSKLIEERSEAPEEKSSLAPLQKEIDQHFSFTTMEEIVESLEQANSPFAQETKAILLSKSPVSLKVTLKQLVDGEQKSLQECFDTDNILASNFMFHNDFFEGVRSVLVDKDRNPQYEYKQLADVSEQLVAQFFVQPD